MLNQGRRTILFGGSLVCSLDWQLGQAWPRFVLPPEEPIDRFELGFVAGVDVLVLHRPEADQARIADAVRALEHAGARLVVPCALPRRDVA